jgi:hypothetical protein
LDLLAGEGPRTIVNKWMMPRLSSISVTAFRWIQQLQGYLGHLGLRSR